MTPSKIDKNLRKSISKPFIFKKSIHMTTAILTFGVKTEDYATSYKITKNRNLEKSESLMILII